MNKFIYIWAASVVLTAYQSHAVALPDDFLSQKLNGCVYNNVQHVIEELNTAGERFPWKNKNLLRLQQDKFTLTEKYLQKYPELTLSAGKILAENLCTDMINLANKSSWNGEPDIAKVIRAFGVILAKSEGQFDKIQWPEGLREEKKLNEKAVNDIKHLIKSTNGLFNFFKTLDLAGLEGNPDAANALKQSMKILILEKKELGVEHINAILDILGILESLKKRDSLSIDEELYALLKWLDLYTEGKNKEVLEALWTDIEAMNKRQSVMRCESLGNKNACERIKKNTSKIEKDKKNILKEMKAEYQRIRTDNESETGQRLLQVQNVQALLQQALGKTGSRSDLGGASKDRVSGRIKHNNIQ